MLYIYHRDYTQNLCSKKSFKRRVFFKLHLCEGKEKRPLLTLHLSFGMILSEQQGKADQFEESEAHMERSTHFSKSLLTLAWTVPLPILVRCWIQLVRIASPNTMTPERSQFLRKAKPYLKSVTRAPKPIPYVAAVNSILTLSAVHPILIHQRSIRCSTRLPKYALSWKIGDLYPCFSQRPSIRTFKTLLQYTLYLDIIDMKPILVRHRGLPKRITLPRFPIF